MNPLIHTLPEDLTGLAPHNFRMNEFHDLSKQVGVPYRTCVLDHGYFYTEGIAIRDETGYELKPNVDFQCTYASNSIQKKAGQTACAVIVIVNPSVASKIYVDAHMVGGRYCSVTPAIGQAALGLLNPSRKPMWKNVTGKPEAFTPSGHWMAVWDFYGFEEFQIKLKRITDSIKVKSQKSYDVLLSAMETKLAAIQAQLDLEYAKLAQHIANHQNPHKVTALQVGLDQVANYSVATQADVEAVGTGVLNKYMTPLRGAQLINVNFLRQLNTHIADTKNPHRVTAAQLNTYTITESNNKFALKLNLHETAQASRLFSGYTYENYFNYVRSNLSMGWLGNGRLPLQRLAAGNPPGRGYALTGANTWINLVDLFAFLSKKPTSVLYMQGLFGSIAAGVNQAAVTFANNTAYPVGTIVLFTYNTTQEIYTGNGGATENYNTLMATVKTAGGWTY